MGGETLAAFVCAPEHRALQWQEGKRERLPVNLMAQLGEPWGPGLQPGTGRSFLSSSEQLML